MKKRSIAAAAAAAAIIFSNAAPIASPMICIYAESAASSSKKDETSEMKKLLATVKSRITVPDELSDFSYRKYTNSGTDSYTFTWKKELDNGNGKVINVTIDEHSVITNYYFSDIIEEYLEEWDRPTFSKMSREQIKKAAENAIKTINPDIADQIVIDDSISINIHGDNIYVRFHRENNGVRLDKNSGSLRINKMTGEVKGFNLSWWSGAEFEAPSKAVSSQAIEKAYKENVALVPFYRINSEYNEKTKKYDKTTVILYSPDKTVQFDASKGTPTTMLDDYALAYNTSRYENGVYYDEEVSDEEEASVENPATGVASDSGAAEVTFTDAEKKALMDSGRYYSKDDITELLEEDKYLGLTSDYMLDSSSFRKDESSPSGYMWTMYFFVNNSKEYKSIHVNVDAESGKIINFYKYAKNPSKVINIKSVNKTAAAAAEYYLGDKFAEYKASEKNTADASAKEVSRTLVFDRYVNDILVDGNQINITVDSDGNVTNFSYTYDDVKFPEPQIITEEEAYKKAFAQTDFNLYYDGFLRLNGDPQTYLLYSLDKFYLNAKTGKLCTSAGKDITEKPKTEGCPYTDISGNWAEKYITKLYDYNIRLTGDDETEFRPDEAITEREFAELMQNLTYNNVMPLLYDGYSYSNRSEFGNDPLTKAGAAKQFILSQGGKKFAEIKGIYVSPFKDVPGDRSDLGYISLAYGMGFVKSDSSGKFHPDAKVTRGYAMYLICNYIENV